MDSTKASLFEHVEYAGFKQLTPAQLNYVRGGRYAVVTIDGTRPGIVDMDRLEWDIITGRIPVTYK